MKKRSSTQLKLVSSLLALAFMVSCKDGSQRPIKAKLGPSGPEANASAISCAFETDTQNINAKNIPSKMSKAPKAKSLAELSADIDKDSFDFDIAKVLGVKDPIKSEKEKAAYEKWGFYVNLTDKKTLVKILGEDAEFFVWALRLSLMSNAEKKQMTDADYKNEVEAYNLSGNKVVKSLNYDSTKISLTQCEGKDLFKIANPTTKQTVAVQDRNNLVLINEIEFDKLSDEEKVSLKIQLSVFHIVAKFNPALLNKSGATTVLEFSKNLFNYFYSSNAKNKAVTDEALHLSYKALGFPKKKL